MKMFYVTSSNVLAIGYELGRLRVRFKDGSEFDYLNVPETVYEELIDSPSIGSYYHREIRAVYESERVLPKSADTGHNPADDIKDHEVPF